MNEQSRELNSYKKTKQRWYYLWKRGTAVTRHEYICMFQVEKIPPLFYADIENKQTNKTLKTKALALLFPESG